MQSKLAPTEVAQLTGGPLGPVFAGLVYGGWRLFKSGWHNPHSGPAWFLVLAGLVTLIIIPGYTAVVLSPPGRSWQATFFAVGAFAILIYGLFEIVVLGLFGVWYAVERHTGFWHLAFAALWVLIGLYLLKKVADIQQAGKRLQTGAAQGLI